MQRRDFIKISAVTGATAALEACGHPEHHLIRFVPEEDLVPGVAKWKPSICILCPAGCGLMVKMMEGEAEVVRNGQVGLIRMGLAKKLEGNPRHPINQGKLCARGQAGLQITYHPDRIKGPLKRSGPRGSGQFQEVGWEDAIKELTGQLSVLRAGKRGRELAFIAGALRGQRAQLVESFVLSLGARPPISFEFLDDAVLRRANWLSFGYSQLPTLDLARSSYVISFGADFLGTWNSPVAQSIAYGEMRQGRPGHRAKLVMIEPRMSQTGASADEWVAAQPGTEGLLALGLCHVILNEKLRPANARGAVGVLITGWSQGLPDYTPEAVEKKTGVPAATISRLAREIATHGPAVAAIGGAPLAQRNGLHSALAVNALNDLLGIVGKSGGVFFTPQFPVPGGTYFPVQDLSPGSASSISALAQQIASGQPYPLSVLLLHNANPVWGMPPDLHIREALEKVPFIASFGGFIDETSVLADLVLPDHSPLESWLDDVPQSGTTQPVAGLAAPSVRPLHNTRAMPDVLLEVAHQLGENVATALPWKTFDEMLKARFERLGGHTRSTTPERTGDAWARAQEQGGLWSSQGEGPLLAAVKMTSDNRSRLVEPEFDGSAADFPFYFLPFPSTLLYDGSLANLPWMQETPDPLSTAMWSTWVEINPKAAERLGIKQGDLVEVASQHGKLQAPALIHPGIAPDAIAMPVGQGHTNYTRYASGRGANPISILAPTVEPETGALAWAATRVRISRLGEGELILFGTELREKPVEVERR